MRRSLLRPEMNVTPLVDVVLVLLIIFMVVTPALEGGAPVDLPFARHPDKAAEKKDLEPLMVSLTAQGQLYVEREPTNSEELKLALTQAHERDPKRRLTVKADRAVPYRDVRSAFKAAQQIGFPGISLQVAERKDD